MSDTTVTHPLVKGEVGPGCAKVDPIVVADGVTRPSTSSTSRSPAGRSPP